MKTTYHFIFNSRAKMDPKPDNLVLSEAASDKISPRKLCKLRILKSCNKKNHNATEKTACEVRNHEPLVCRAMKWSSGDIII